MGSQGLSKLITTTFSTFAKGPARYFFLSKRIVITTQDNKYNIKERKSTTYIIQKTQTIEPIIYPTRWRTRTERLKKKKKKRARGGSQGPVRKSENQTVTKSESQKVKN